MQRTLTCTNTSERPARIYVALISSSPILSHFISLHLILSHPIDRVSVGSNTH